MDGQNYESNVEYLLEPVLLLAVVLLGEEFADLEPKCSLLVLKCKHALRIIEVGNEEEDEEGHEAVLENRPLLFVPEAIEQGID